MKKILVNISLMTILIFCLTGCASSKHASDAGYHYTANNSEDVTVKWAPPQQIAVLLPLSGKYAQLGKQVRQGILDAYYKHQDDTNTQNIKFYDTQQGTNITSLYQASINEGADFVIGPLLKPEVKILSQYEAIKTPLLALNYSKSKPLSRQFYEFGLLPEDEIEQAVKHATQTGLSKALVIVPQNALGERLAKTFKNAWGASKGTVVDTLTFTPQANYSQDVAQFLGVDPDMDRKLIRENSNRATLENQRRQDFDVVFIFAPSKDAHAIVPLLHFNYVNNIPIYASSSALNSKNKRSNRVDLNGVIICDLPYGNSHILSDSQRLYALGKDAYVLSNAIIQLKDMHQIQLQGETGMLFLTDSRQIHRTTPCRKIKNA